MLPIQWDVSLWLAWNRHIMTKLLVARTTHVTNQISSRRYVWPRIRLDRCASATPATYAFI